jgi:hypothetical protein
MPLAYKAGVRVQRRTLALMHIENSALAAQAALGYPSVLVATSINDSRHVEGSKHYTDDAIDWRTKGPAANTMGSTARKRRFRQRLSALLGDRFTVLLEGLGHPYEHIHVQVKQGERYP